MNKVRAKLLRLMQIAYHRMPLSRSLKWRLRERLSPLLEVLLQERNKSLLRAIKLLFSPHSEVAASTETAAIIFEDTLNQIIKYLATFAQQSGPISHIIALPFLSTGGAEMTAINFAKAIRELRDDCTVLIIIADRSNIDTRLPLDQGIHTLVLNDFFGDAASYEIKSKALLQLLLTIKPQAFHNINSEVAWKLIIEHGARLRLCMQVVANIFALQFTQHDKKLIGYAANFLVEGLPQLNRLLTDNRRFIDQAIEKFDIADGDQEKFLTIYNPARNDVLTCAKSGEVQRAYLETATSNRRLKILWAGRLDAEKRVDLLLEIADLCEFAEFDVFGQTVINDQAALSFADNVSFHGPFISPSEWLANSPYDAFIFTSRWEGLPNILVEVGMLGIPIIAPTVGGVGELVTSSTGFPLPEDASAKEYIDALREVRENPSVALNKALQMVDLINNRHNWPTFIQCVSAIPHYLRKTEK